MRQNAEQKDTGIILLNYRLICIYCHHYIIIEYDGDKGESEIIDAQRQRMEERLMEETTIFDGLSMNFQLTYCFL